jgi:hypothetical protein
MEGQQARRDRFLLSRQRLVIEVRVDGTWHLIRPLYECDAGIALPALPLNLWRAINRASKSDGEDFTKSKILRWKFIEARRPQPPVCPKCTPPWPEPVPGHCDTCHGAGRLVPVPWADATPTLPPQTP